MDLIPNSIEYLEQWKSRLNRRINQIPNEKKQLEREKEYLEIELYTVEQLLGIRKEEIKRVAEAGPMENVNGGL